MVVRKVKVRVKERRVSNLRDGKLPRGTHEIGFKELSWSLKDLNEFVNTFRRN